MIFSLCVFNAFLLFIYCECPEKMSQASAIKLKNHPNKDRIMDKVFSPLIMLKGMLFIVTPLYSILAIIVLILGISEGDKANISLAFLALLIIETTIFYAVVLKKELIKKTVNWKQAAIQISVIIVVTALLLTLKYWIGGVR